MLSKVLIFLNTSCVKLAKYPCSCFAERDQHVSLIEKLFKAFAIYQCGRQGSGKKFFINQNVYPEVSKPRVTIP